MTLPRGPGAAPILPVDRRPTDGELAALDKSLPEQPLHLALTVAGARERAGWWGAGRAAGWYDAIEAVAEVAEALGLDIHVRAASRMPWHPGRCAELRLRHGIVGDEMLGEAVLGHAGERIATVITGHLGIDG